MNKETNKLIPELRFPEFVNNGEWEQKILNEITSSIFDGTHQTPKYTENGIPFFSVENLISGNKNKFISVEDHKIGTNKNKPEKFDILITRIGNIGFPKIIDWDYDFSIYVTLAVIKKSVKFDSYYLHSFIQSDFYQKEIKSKSLLNATPCKINMDELRKTKILLPPDREQNEQKKIASCLSSLDELITVHSDKLETLKTYKKGLMQNLFPQEGEKVPKIRFKEFENDGDWEEEILGKICDVRDGTHDSPKYVTNGYPMITSKNLLDNGMIDFENVSFLTEEDYIQINKRSKVDINDILFGMIGTIGNPVIVKTDGFAIKNVALIKSIGKLNQKFLLHQLKSNYILTQFEKVNAGGILKFIALGVIRNLTVIVSSIKEQQKIANTLSSLDEIIKEQDNKIEQLKLHKKGLMQGLFPKVKA